MTPFVFVILHHDGGHMSHADACYDLLLQTSVLCYTMKSHMGLLKDGINKGSEDICSLSVQFCS